MSQTSVSESRRKQGKPPKLSPEKEKALVAMYEEGEIKVAEIAEMFSVGRSTVFDIVRRHKGKPRGKKAA